jgi:hypothetical protein
MSAVTFVRSTALAALLVVSFAALSQDKYPINSNSGGSTSKYTQQHKIDVGDVPGHIVRIQETHRIYNEKSTLVIRGTKVKEGWVQGFSDYTNGKGRAWGYGHWALEDGEKIFLDYSGQSHSEPTSTGSLKGSYHGTTRIVGGTGKYKGIRGTVTDTVSFDTDPNSGYNTSDGKGEYWFEE